MNAARKVLRWIDQNGCSDAEFSRMAGVTKSFVSTLRKNPDLIVTIYQAKRISGLMGVTLDWLFDESVEAEGVPIRGEAPEYLSPDDRAILGQARLLGPAEAMRRLLYPAAKDAPTPDPVVWRPLAVQDLTPRTSGGQPKGKDQPPQRGGRKPTR